MTVRKRLVINELEALIVRDAFRLLLQHRQVALIARTLNDENKLPRGSRCLPGTPLRWSKDAIARVLRNPLYAGMIACGDEQFRGEHPAIVDDETFERAQRILKGRERHTKFHGVNSDYVLRGLVRCGLCKQAMSPGSTRRARKTYRYYRCSTRDKHGPKGCPAAPLPARAIEDYVVERVAEAALDGALAREVESTLAARLDARREQFALLRTKLPVAIATHSANAMKLVEELTRLDAKAREFVEAKLSAETQKLVAAERRLADAERGVAALENAALEARHVVSALRDFRAVWQAMTMPNRGRMLRALLDHVEVDEPSGRIDIHLVDFAADPDVASDVGAPPMEAA